MRWRRAHRRARHPHRRQRRRIPAARSAGAVRGRRQRRRPLPVGLRPGREPRGVHQHRADQRVPRLRRDADGARTTSSRSTASPADRAWTRPRSAGATSRRAATSAPSGEVFDTDIARRGVPRRRARRDSGRAPRRARRASASAAGFACNAHPYGRNVCIERPRDGLDRVRAGRDAGRSAPASPTSARGRPRRWPDIAGEFLGHHARPDLRAHRRQRADAAVGGTFATRQLYMSGNAVQKVARELRDEARAGRSGAARTRAGGAPWCDYAVHARRGPAAQRSRSASSRARPSTARDAVPPRHVRRRDGQVRPEHRAWAGPRPDYTYGAHVVDVEVDTQTGEVRVLNYVACHDVGRAIDVQRVEGQIQGAVAQGIGLRAERGVEVSGGVVRRRRCSPTT